MIEKRKYGQAQHGWGKVIACDLYEYLRTIIAVREAYGDPEDGSPSDWWMPYAYDGSRYDRDENPEG